MPDGRRVGAVGREEGDDRPPRPGGWGGDNVVMVFALLPLPLVLLFAASVTVLIGLPLRLLARWLQRKGRQLERRRPEGPSGGKR